MAGTPYIKIYDAQGEYEAACKNWETAAVIVSFLGPGSTIRAGHSKNRTVWTEGNGKDGSAADSYDLCADRCIERLEGFENA